MLRSSGTRAGWAALVERDSEHGLIHAALTSAERGSGRVALLYGPAGIGRSSLLRAAALEATQRGFTVLEACGSEFERGYGFGVVRQLFEERIAALPDDARDELVGDAGPAVDAALGIGGAPAGGTDAGYRQIQGVHRMVTRLAVANPVALVVDDLQWCDRLSLDFLCFLGHRATRSPVIVVATWRRGEPGVRAGRLQALAGRPETLFLAPEPLSGGGVRAFLHLETGTEPDPEIVDAVLARTGGQPLLLGQLVAALLVRLIPPTADRRHTIEAITPEPTRRDTVARLGRQPEAVRNLAHAVAILGEAPLVQAAELAGLEPDRARVAADALVRSGMLGDASTLAYLQPILRDAVYGTLSSLECANLHGRAAALLCGDRDEPDPANLERAAGHLLNSEPSGDPRHADALRTAAALARGRGADREAQRLLERALREIADPCARAPVLTQLAVLELRAGAPRRAEKHSAEALSGADRPDERAAAALALAHARGVTENWRGAVEVLDDEAAALVADRPELARELRAASAIVRACARAPWAAPEVSGDEPALLAAHAAHLACAGVGTAEQAAGLCARALADRPEPAVAYLAGQAAIAADRLDIAEAMLAAPRDGVDLAVDLAVVDLAVVGPALRAQLALARGDLGDADRDARAALSRLDGAAPVPVLRRIRLDVRTALATVAIERGRYDDAEQALDGLAELGHGDEPASAALALALALARSEPKRAISDEEPPQLPTGGLTQAASWRAQTALAAHAAGDDRLALVLADRQLEHARAWGAPSARGSALVVRGLIDPGPGRVDLLEQAVAVLEDAPSRLELARASIELGSALRRARRRSEARERLTLGADLAHRCGADALAARARAELVALGARPRRAAFSGVGALTASELRVAQLAADGMTNRAIAQQITVSVKTVAGQLTAVYRKLDIHDRSALAAAMRQAAEGERSTAAAPEAAS
jgi:DNA-binding CsgD family transcriptional regulator